MADLSESLGLSQRAGDNVTEIVASLGVHGDENRKATKKGGIDQAFLNRLMRPRRAKLHELGHPYARMVFGEANSEEYRRLFSTDSKFLRLGQKLAEYL